MEPMSQSVTANQLTNHIIVRYRQRAHLNIQHARSQPQKRPCCLLLQVTRPSTNQTPKGLRLSHIITSVTLCTTLLLIAEPPASHDVRYYSLKPPGWSITWHYPDLLRTTHRTTDETPAHREPTGTCSETKCTWCRNCPTPLHSEAHNKVSHSILPTTLHNVDFTTDELYLHAASFGVHRR